MTLNPGVSSVTTVGNGTLTAAILQTTNVLRTGPTGAFTDTTDTATNIVAALGVPGGAYEVLYVNNTSYVATLAAGTGVTLAGASAAIPANSLTTLLVATTTGGAVTVTVLYRATAA